MSIEDDPPGADEPLVRPLGETAGAGGGEEAGEAEAEPVSPGVPASPRARTSAPASTGAPAAAMPPPAETSGRGAEPMLSRRHSRSAPERLFVRLVATCGIVGIGVAIAAIMVSSKSQGWVVGMVVSIVSVILAAILWSSRVL